MERDDDDTSAKNGSGWLKGGSTNSSDVAAYYDDWAGAYDATLRGWDYRAPADAAAALCRELQPGAAILDVGCGTGMFARAMSNCLDCRIEGVDISATSLEVAGKLGLYDRLQCHDLQVTPLPLADNAFDAAACVGVLTYIEEPSALLADLCRVVRPGGYILFTQRDDLWGGMNFDALISGLEQRRLWTPLSVSEPQPYLPNNEDFSDTILAIHVLCRVV